MLTRREILYLNESNKIEDIHSIQYVTDSSLGHAAAWDLIKRNALLHKPLSLDDICEAQKLLMDEQERVGNFIPLMAKGSIRSESVPFNVGVGSYTAPSFEKVPELMAQYFAELNSELSDSTMPPIDMAAIFHKKFESIHPFVDGNGRTGRLVANYIMKFFQLPIVIFNYYDRKTYYIACANEELMIGYFREKFREHGSCISCENDLTKRTSKGIEADIYLCDVCGSTYAMDWQIPFSTTLKLQNKFN